MKYSDDDFFLVTEELVRGLVVPCLNQLLDLVQAGQPETALLQEPLLLLIGQVGLAT